MTLREARVLFTRLKAEWITWVFAQGYELTASEGYVKDTDAADGDYDGPHMNGGAHYTGTGEDFNLFIDKQLVTNSDHPVWKKIGAKWKTMHERCRWGGDFAKKDANHISIEFGGKA